MQRIIECVPNFSEGRDPAIIRQIADTIGQGGARVLHVDAGQAANRTVITFAGTPDAVVESAYRGVEAAGRLIDMSRHHGTHPRIGATDVLPLVPVSGVTLDECARLARQLAERISSQLLIPCYLYEAAALQPAHRNLATCRIGQYEGLAARMADATAGPDLGRRPWDERMARTGCSVVGARDFLIAVNFNVNTRSASEAHAVARRVRERDGGLKGVKALGWYIEEYGCAQVSMNITDIHATPLHVAYEAVCREALAQGLRVTGTELIGLLPLHCLLDAGRHFLAASSPSQPSAPSQSDLIATAVRVMGLDALRPFQAEKKVIELCLQHSSPLIP